MKRTACNRSISLLLKLTSRESCTSSVFCWHFLIPSSDQWRIDSDECLSLVRLGIDASLRFYTRSCDSQANQILSGASERRAIERTAKKNNLGERRKKIKIFYV